VTKFFDEAEGKTSEQVRLLERLGFLERIVRTTDVGVESLRRRLPITIDTAATIGQWQNYRAALDLPGSTRRWLFPQVRTRPGKDI
jgi:hypothetical protein